MGQQVITVSPTGAISGLQVKPGKGIDLRQFGKADIQRASEIAWDAEAQRWTVQIVKGDLAGITLTRSMLEVADQFWSTGTGSGTEEKDHTPVYFTDYDEAVAAEIRYLDFLRLTRPHLLD